MQLLPRVEDQLREDYFARVSSTTSFSRVIIFHHTVPGGKHWQPYIGH
jgi:hypothetical protein